ncbi:MAG: response regulator [Desulfobacterales bacterium]|nr:response regulator [Desulfobacterales bacterium]
MKILVVEDDENSRVLQQDLLESEGYEVWVAENGKDALLILKGKAPDLIISDILMPVMDGYALCRAIRNDPELRDIPFIFYTATYTSPMDEQLARDLGANRFLIKPMDPMKFLEEVKNTVNQCQSKNDIIESDKSVKSPIKLEEEYAAVLARKLDKKVADLEHVQDSLKKAQKIAHIGNWDWCGKSDNLWFSDEMFNILGINPEQKTASIDILQKSVHQDDQEKVSDAICKAINQGIPFQLEHRIVLPDGKNRIIVQEAEISVKDPETGRPIRIVCTVQDITERKKLEQEKAKFEETLRRTEKSRALGTLASGIAHDFNNILMIILGYAEMIKLHLQQDSSAFSYAHQIIAAGKRAAELINQILAFSRHVEQEKRPIEIQPIVKEIIKFIRSSIPATIEIKQKIDKQCPAIMGDTTQIHQVVMNLCTNAYYSMKDTGGMLSVYLEKVLVDPIDPITKFGVNAGVYVRLGVSDTGCGIEKNILERVFEPYFTTKPQGEGTGLGLAVVQGIVQGHHGHIKVYSETGKGSTFHVYFPIINIVKQEEKENLLLEKIKRGKGQHILVVDDEEQIIHILKTMLIKMGYRVTATNNSKEALSLFTKNPLAFDMVITDIAMPHMNGKQLSEAIFEIRKDIPIIVCTGFTEIMTEKDKKQFGIKKYLMKPVLFTKLAEALDEIWTFSK